MVCETSEKEPSARAEEDLELIGALGGVTRTVGSPFASKPTTRSIRIVNRVVPEGLMARTVEAEGGALLRDPTSSVTTVTSEAFIGIVTIRDDQPAPGTVDPVAAGITRRAFAERGSPVDPTTITALLSITDGDSRTTRSSTQVRASPTSAIFRSRTVSV